MKNFGKLLLSAYLMKKINSRVSRSRGGIISKYAKLMLVGYLFKKLKLVNVKSEKFEEKVEPVKIAEPVETVEPVEETALIETEERGSSRMRIAKIAMGALAGATLVYAMKKRAAKKRAYKIQVE
jgi:hypothetical protein